MRPRAAVALAWLLALAAVLTSCADSAATSDASAPVDLGASNDLAPDRGESTVSDAGVDVPADVRRDGSIDADVPSPSDARADVPTDVGVDSGLWGDTPLVDVGGIMIPVDPNAVPAPGSECTDDASVRPGDPTVAPPRPIRPLSVSRVTSQRPTFQWVLPEGTTGARIEVCADRCCTRVLQTIDAEGTTTRPMTALPPGVVFWRMFGRRGTVVGSRASYTWEFEVRRRDAPNDTSWGTIRDFNGDGYDDLVEFRPRMFSSTASDLVVVPGSPSGLGPPIVSGVTTENDVYDASVGDFNGDGLADITWVDREPGNGLPYGFAMVHGSAGPLRSFIRATAAGMPQCPRTGRGVAVDWNGDGYSDLVVAMFYGCDDNLPLTGSALIAYFGSSVGIASTPQWAARIDGPFPHPGLAVNGGIGDVDSDGYGDVTVMSQYLGRGTSSVPPAQAIVHGTPHGIPRVDRIPQPADARFGWEESTTGPAGDVDGDGFQDFVLSVNGSSPFYVYRHITGLMSPSMTLVPSVAGGAFGSYFGHGDVNGDGLGDVIVSSPLEPVTDDIGRPVSRGRVYVFLGSPGGTLAVPVWVQRARGVATTERELVALFGGLSMSPGDINGDGIDDVLMEDSINFRLCLRLGRVGLDSGAPDRCLDNLYVESQLY